MQDREDVAAADEPGECGRAVRRPRLRADPATRRPRSSRAFSVPETPATASEETKTSRIDGSATPARRISTSARTVERSKRESPDPSAMRTPASGTPASASVARTTRAPAALEPRVVDGRPELLQHHLGDEVVAVRVHPPDDPRQLLREVEGDGEGLGGCSARAGASADDDASLLQSFRERASSGSGRAVRAGERKAGDRERRQRWRLDAEVRELPAEPVASRVEVRVVPEDATRDAPNPRRRESPGHAVEVRSPERGVAVADEAEVAVPDAPRTRADADDLRAEPEVRPENPERRERNRELLGRGREERAGDVLPVHRLARPQVEGDRRGPVRGHARRAKCLLERAVEPGRCRGSRRCRRCGKRQRHGQDDQGCPSGSHGELCTGGRRRRRVR